MSGDAAQATRIRIADGAIRVIARDGFDAVSVRTAASEAGLAPGTIQHHFPSRDDLLTAAMNRAIERQLARVAALPTEGDPARRLREALMDLLPLTEESREEGIVWLAFSAAAPTRRSLAERHRANVDLLRGLIGAALRAEDRRGVLLPGLDLTLEAALIAAVVDGLLLHGVNARAGEASLLTDALAHALDRLYVPS